MHKRTKNRFYVIPVRCSLNYIWSAHLFMTGNEIPFNVRMKILWSRVEIVLSVQCCEFCEQDQTNTLAKSVVKRMFMLLYVMFPSTLEPLTKSTRQYYDVIRDNGKGRGSEGGRSSHFHSHDCLFTWSVRYLPRTANVPPAATVWLVLGHNPPLTQID